MRWFRLLSRSREVSAASIAAVGAVRAPAGIEYLLIQAGRAEPAFGHQAAQVERSVTQGVPWQELCEQAEHAQMRGDCEEADALWRTMRAEFPNIWHSYAGCAVTLCSLGRYDDARELLSKAAARFPEERAIPLALGRLAQGLADWPAAEMHWRQALTFDVRPWWVYTELAGALEQQGRITDAEEVLLEAQLQAEEPNEITLFTYPAKLAWKRQDWATAATRWVEARRRFPHAAELPAKQYEALMRLGQHDPAAYETTIRDLGLEPLGESMGELMLRFESLGGTGPDGGCEFGCFQRQHGAEPLGLFRWAAVSPASLIACLNARFARIGEMDAIEIAPHEGQWEITDTAYGTKMHSFVSIDEVTHDRMIVLASKRMRYLANKLIAELENPDKIFVLKVAWQHVTTLEIDGLSEAIRSYGNGHLLCGCAADEDHAEGTIVAASQTVFMGYIDFSGRLDVAQRRPEWEVLCRAVLDITGRLLSQSVS